MQNLKNISVGFLVSFIGSIPLGYLNVVGYNIFNSSGLSATVNYLLGVVFIEFFVILGTLLFANILHSNLKILKFIEAFSVFFMFILAYVFYLNGISEQENRTVFSIISHSFFISGIVLSCLNFIQIPFWLSWNLYLLNGNFIEISKHKKYFYIVGTITGTFAGMLVLILSLNYLALEFEFFKLFLFRFVFPFVFVGLGIFQGIKFYKKYFK